jgi:putative oxidoreductase
MERLLGSYSPYVYAILRIVTGFLFLMHGTQKVLGTPARLPNPCQCPPQDPPSQLMAALSGASGYLELILGLLILIGLFGRLAGFLASGMMAVAYFAAHQPRGVLPIQNAGELAALYCFVFLYIAMLGSGPLSVDSLLSRRNSAGDLGADE